MSPAQDWSTQNSEGVTGSPPCISPKCIHSQKPHTQPGQEAEEKAMIYESGVLLFRSQLDSNFLLDLGQDHLLLWTSVFFKRNKRLGLDDFKGVSELLK